jgi:hypothetical protein
MTRNAEIEELVRRLAPRITHVPADDLHTSTTTAKELLTMITTQPPDESEVPIAGRPRPGGRRSGRGGRPARRRLLVGAPIAIGVAVAAVAAVVLAPSSPTGPGPAPASADALEITSDGDLVVARVSDPDADPSRYAAEFAERGLDVRLRLIPASPTAVGAVIYLDSNASGTGTDERDVEVIDAPGECRTGGGACPVGIRIPDDYGNTVDVAFGRQAEPGESYDATNAADAPGEALAGVDVAGQRVSQAVDVLAQNGQRATEFHRLVPGTAETVVVPADEVPGDWYVYEVSLRAPGEVTLDVGDTPERPRPAEPAVPPSAPPPGSGLAGG